MKYFSQINSEPFPVWEARLILRRLKLPYDQKFYRISGNTVTLFDDFSAHIMKNVFDVRYNNDESYSIFKSKTKFVISGQRNKKLKMLDCIYKPMEGFYG